MQHAAPALALTRAIPNLFARRWVRKAAARLLGLGLAAECVAGGMLEREGRAGELALRLYMQLEAEVVDEPLCLQVGCCWRCCCWRCCCCCW
jgi:hypothetical protein